MPDISMCPGDDCPRKETCYRYTATPNQFRQSYFTKAVYDKKDTTKMTCMYYWETEKRKGKGDNALGKL